jgi:hypothetical protein
MVALGTTAPEVSVTVPVKELVWPNTLSARIDESARSF